MKKDNKGWSLIEIIVVLAILAIAGLIGISGLGYIFGTEVKSCANEIYSAIGETRINTMGRYETAIHFYEDTDGYYAQEWQLIGGSWVSNNAQQIGNSYLTLQYTTGAGTPATIDSNGIWVGFDRSNGKERALSSPLPDGGSGATGIFDSIIVSGAITRTVTIVPATGKLQINS